MSRPEKISIKNSLPKKIVIFLKTPKNTEFQIFDPQKKRAPTINFTNVVRNYFVCFVEMTQLSHGAKYTP